jgi:hypothetical protein
MGYVYLNVSILELGNLDFLGDFVIDLAVVYDTFVAVMLLCVCRLSLYLTIISQLCRLSLFICIGTSYSKPK